MEFKAPGKAANKDDWNKFLMATKVETGERESSNYQILLYLKSGKMNVFIFF